MQPLWTDWQKLCACVPPVVASKTCNQCRIYFVDKVTNSYVYVWNFCVWEQAMSCVNRHGFKRACGKQCIMELTGSPFKPKLKKFKKNSPWKFFLYFPEKCFSCILENGTFLYFLKKVFLIFPGMELFSLKCKKFQEVTFRAQKMEKVLNVSYFLGNGIF